MKVDLRTIQEEINNNFFLRDSELFTSKAETVSLKGSNKSLPLPSWYKEVRSLRLMICYAFGSKVDHPCFYWMGITNTGNIHFDNAGTNYFQPNESSFNDAYMGTLRALLRDVPEVKKYVLNYKFKTDGSMFAYWSNSGKMDISSTRRRVNGKPRNPRLPWAGDILIGEAIKPYKGMACRLFLKGYTVQEILDNPEEFLDDSRERHELLKEINPNRIRIKDFNNYVVELSNYLWDSEHTTERNLGELTSDDIREWRLFSRVCEAGTLAWIKRYPVVTQLGLNGLIESYKHMPKSYFEGMLGMSDGKNAYDDKLIAFLNEYSK